jgi:DNA repair protein RadD
MLNLRPYQQEAVASTYRHLRERDDNPCVVIPAGGGKTLVMATIIRGAVERWEGRVLILVHGKEHFEQATVKLHQVAPEIYMKTGVYSAGINSRDTQQPVIIAGIQSVYMRACEFNAFDLIIIDEAHMIPPGAEGMYRALLEGARKVSPNLRVIGLAAMPFRLRGGMVCTPENVLNHVCYEIGVKELIVQGYLRPLVTKAGREKVDTSGLRIRAGDFDANEVEDLMDARGLVRSVCNQIVEETRMRQSVLIFAAGIQHGYHIAKVMRKKYGMKVGTAIGDTLDFERDWVFSKFQSGEWKYLVSVNVPTACHDAPYIDSVAIVRPTLSPGLYHQMVGCGLRTSEGKADCLVLDFGGNALRHGPVDAIRIDDGRGRRGDKPVVKECPGCRRLIAAGYSACPDCQHRFPPPENLSDKVRKTDHAVVEVSYSVHRKLGSGDMDPRTLRVTYLLESGIEQSEWICFEHTGSARKRAEAWWRRRSNALVPGSAKEAARLANVGALCKTAAIIVRRVGKDGYDRIVGYVLGPKPHWREPGWDEDESEQVDPVYTYANEGKTAL